MNVLISNAEHPNFGVASIPFPIKKDEYEEIISGFLESLEIGDVQERDCFVEAVRGPWPVLKRLENQKVNIDELDYLTKRLDGFDIGEAAQFQAMAEKLDLTDMTDLINLTFCCQRATVITDFTDLESVGRDHYLNLHGGSAKIEELENLEGLETALLLIDSGGGTITPYGVVYDNGMRLEQHYDGRNLPEYHYEPESIMLSLKAKAEGAESRNISYVYLPTSDKALERVMLRTGINDPDDLHIELCQSQLPEGLSSIIDPEHESIFDLNRMAEAISKLSEPDVEKLVSAVVMTDAVYSFQVCELAKNLDMFDFAPKVHSPKEYGEYMIQESGHFEFDPNLDEFYDYEKYGRQRMEQESGMFAEYGYISYHGEMSLEELLMADPEERLNQEQGFQMGGM